MRPWRALLAMTFAFGVMSCSGAKTADTPTTPVAVVSRITVSSSTLNVTVGASVQFIATALDGNGRVITAPITWSSSAPAVATVSSVGLVSGVSAGTATISATSSGVTGATTVTVATASITYVPGQSYFGRNNYIEYVAGNAPVILSAPHGGALTPASIPDRTTALCGVAPTTVTDANTVDLVRAMQARFFAKFGTYPHIIISQLSRRKLDPNRLQPEAACGNAEATVALDEWHAYIDIAKAAVLRSTGRGWYMDMHGHGHTIQRLELGYLLADADIDRTDAALDASTAFENTASIRTLSQLSPLSFSALLRGPTSLGSLYANSGFPAVPSASDPRVNGADYFNGGDNTRRHSCGSDATPLGGATNGNICGVQIEANFTGVRDNAANRDRFGDVTAVVLEEYLRTHWNIRLGTP